MILAVVILIVVVVAFVAAYEFFDFLGQESKYYDSIHNCPILYWDWATKENNPKHLLRSGKHKEGKGWKELRNISVEFVDEFGIASSHKIYLRMKAKAANTLLKAYEKDMAFLPVAKIMDAEAERFKKTIPSIKFSQQLKRASQEMGFRVDPKKTTVAEFYGYVNSINEA